MEIKRYWDVLVDIKGAVYSGNQFEGLLGTNKANVAWKKKVNAEA